MPTIVSGLAEWAESDGGPRRVGVAHALGSSLATLLYGASYLARRGRRDRAAVAFGLAGGLVELADGYVGGHLTLAHRVGTGVR